MSLRRDTINITHWSMTNNNLKLPPYDSLNSCTLKIQFPKSDSQIALQPQQPQINSFKFTVRLSRSDVVLFGPDNAACCVCAWAHSLSKCMQDRFTVRSQSQVSRWKTGNGIMAASLKTVQKKKKLVKDGEACFVFINFSVTYLPQQMYNIMYKTRQISYYCSLISFISPFLQRTGIWWECKTKRPSLTMRMTY